MRKRLEKIIESKNDDSCYIAGGIGKRKCVVCITNKDGSIIEKTKIWKYILGSRKICFSFGLKYSNRKCHTVVESTANMWLKTYEAFEKNRIDVKLANPTKTKAIAEARIKTDKLNARILTHLLQSDLIAESYIVPDNVREDRSLLRLRINLVSNRTSYE